MSKIVKNKTFVVKRDSKTGKFTDVKTAKRSPANTTVERVSKVGYGAVGRGSKSGRFIEEHYTVSSSATGTLAKISKRRRTVIKNLAKR